MDTRQQQIVQWIENDLGYKQYSLQPASADASFRRYFRLTDPVNKDSKIIMDAPPEKEDSHPFIRIALSLAQAGLNVPVVYAQNFELGFFLLSDLGKVDYLSEINEANADQLYSDAMQTLLQIQANTDMVLPEYDSVLLNQEMQLFTDWFLLKHRQLELQPQQHAMLNETYGFLTESALSQPQVCVHRDYHSRNLMVSQQQNPGVLDFQDAVLGPITYDLVSLLRDCYVAWPQQKVEQWLKQFHLMLSEKDILPTTDFMQFERWFDLMGIQRHLKAVGIFSRLNYRDAKPGYLNDIPRTLGYVSMVSSKYPQLKAFNQFIEPLLETEQANTGD